MDNLDEICLGNFMYLDPNGTITLSIAFDGYMFDYMFLDTNNNKIKIK